MQQLPHRRQDPEPDPRITVLPHISAPIDDGPFFPKPPLTWWQKGVRVVVLAVVTVPVLGYLFVHASALR